MFWHENAEFNFIHFFQTFINALGQSVLSGIHKNVENSFRKSMEVMIIPSYEKITREMFRDLGKAFNEGTKDCELVNLSF